jgi:ABC-2 type transport system permease protein
MTVTTITPRVAAGAQPSEPRLGRILRAAANAEWTKIRSVRSTVWTLLVAIALAVGFGVLIAVTQIDSWDALEPAARARFDATAMSLSGLFLAQLAIGVLGVLLMTSEYATGQIRATLAATPQRLVVLAAKTIAFVTIVLVIGLIASFSAFGIGQAIFSSERLGVSLSEPGVLRAVIGGALYLAAVGVLGIGLGTIVRRTAGAITALVGLLMILPFVASFLPASWNEMVGKYFPSRAGMAVFNVVPDPASLSPWAGFAVLLAYAALSLVAGGILLARQDA